MFLKFKVRGRFARNKISAQNKNAVLISKLNFDLYVCCFDALMSRSPSRGPNNF